MPRSASKPPAIHRERAEKQKQLEALRDRLANAAGPNYALDCKIEHLCAPERARWIGNARPYTSSLDAAVTLVPPNLWWMIACGRLAPSEPLWAAHFEDPESKIVIAEAEHAANAAICLCLCRVEYELQKEAHQ